MDKLNEASDNSVQGDPASKHIPQDGTGKHSSRDLSSNNPTDHSPGVIQLDPYLQDFAPALKSRYAKAQQWIKTINDTEGGLDKFSKGYERFGFTVAQDGTITYREWAPNAV